MLFCLGLASSRGMRAERLPDLVNSTLLKAGRAAETVVSVRFDLSDCVTRMDALITRLAAPRADGPRRLPTGLAALSSSTASRKR